MLKILCYFQILWCSRRRKNICYETVRPSDCLHWIYIFIYIWSLRFRILVWSWTSSGWTIKSWKYIYCKYRKCSRNIEVTSLENRKVEEVMIIVYIHMKMPKIFKAQKVPSHVNQKFAKGKGWMQIYSKEIKFCEKFGRWLEKFFIQPFESKIWGLKGGFSIRSSSWVCHWFRLTDSRYLNLLIQRTFFYQRFHTKIWIDKNETWDLKNKQNKKQNF